MLVLRPRPSARSSPEPAVSGGGSSLERNPGASMGWKKRDTDHCIGLGIVAALEKSPPAASQMVVIMSAPIAISAAHIGRIRCPHGTERRDTGGFFSVSPTACEDEPPAGFRAADFLSQCHLCRKRLHGKDIYMYRGEKAFCSMECRYQQIVSDEFKEKCWSTAASAAAADAASPYAGGGRLFLIPGIAAA